MNTRFTIAAAILAVGALGLVPYALFAESPEPTRKEIGPDYSPEAQQRVPKGAREEVAERVRAYRRRWEELAEKKPRSIKYGCRFGPVERRIPPQKLREIVTKHHGNGRVMWAALQRIPDDPSLDPIVISVPSEEGPNCRVPPPPE